MDELIQKLLWVAVYATSTIVRDALRCEDIANMAVESYVRRFSQKEQNDGK